MKNFSERFVEGQAIQNLEVAYNDYLDQEGASYADAAAMIAHLQTIRVMNEKARLDAANREIERQANAEAERVEAEKSAHVDALRASLRDSR